VGTRSSTARSDCDDADCPSEDDATALTLSTYHRIAGAKRCPRGGATVAHGLASARRPGRRGEAHPRVAGHNPARRGGGADR